MQRSAQLDAFAKISFFFIAITGVTISILRLGSFPLESILEHLVIFRPATETRDVFRQTAPI